MQRLNRSTPAPRTSAFLLFLGLAIVPISLKAAGIQVSFNPSLSAAADAWQQIADVFGSGYQPARVFDSSTPTDQAKEPSRAFDSSACPKREFACAREANELSAPVAEVSKVRAPQAEATRRGCPKAARALAVPAAVEQSIAAASREGLQTYGRALGTLSAVKLEAVAHGSLLRNDALLMDIERHFVERKLVIPQSLRMLVRVKSQAIPSATKAAQCKVRAALDSARRIERERAILTSLSSSNPDNCEL
jgi:hypothetical protein